MVFNPDFLNSEPEEEQANPLLNYLQHQSPDVLSQVAKSASPEVQQIISQNVQGLVGMLPSETFNVQITTNRENLAGLLASAMMTGYFLRQMEQRMELEEMLINSTPLRRQPHPGEKSADSSKPTDQ
jgi:CheY-specific phosphatase CheX